MKLLFIVCLINGDDDGFYGDGEGWMIEEMRGWLLVNGVIYVYWGKENGDVLMKQRQQVGINNNK